MFLKFLFIFCFSLLVKSSFCQTINGTVLDIHGNEIIPFCPVILTQSDKKIAETITDIDGIFKFSEVSPATYKLITKYIGCNDDPREIVLNENSKLQITIALKCEKRIICIEKLDASTTVSLTDSSKVRDFISLLNLDAPKPNHLYSVYVSGYVGPSWIKINDLEYLMTLIDSKNPSKCVLSEYASEKPSEELSTIGGQVMNIIDAYRYNKKYPFFLVDCSKTNRKRVKEIRRWWKYFNKRK